MAKPLLAALKTMGQIETHVQRIVDLEKRLQGMPLWKPAAIIHRQAAAAKAMIGGMQERLDDRLVVTLIGPSGAGKSTLFNALPANIKANILKADYSKAEKNCPQKIQIGSVLKKTYEDLT